MAPEQMVMSDAGLAALLGGMFLGIFIVAVILYVIMSFALMKIAQKTNTENAWMAWIPIANVFLMVFIAKKEWWWALIILLAGIIPFIGAFVSLGVSIYIWWLICEVRGKTGALSLLMLLPLIGPLILILYLAFSE